MHVHPRAAAILLATAWAALAARGAGAQTEFFPLTPCRLLDTRNPAGPSGGPPLAPGQKRIFAASGTCGVPANAVDIVVNVAVVTPAAAGFAQVFPGNGSAPVTSVLNFRAGRTRSDNAFVALATDGSGTLALLNNSTGPADFVVDVSGYFAATSCPSITVTNPAVTTGTEGTLFSQSFSQTGGAGAPTFSLASGALPAGWTLSQSGVLSSANPVFGQFTISVVVHDANLCAGTGGSYTVSIAPGARDDVYGPTIVGNMSIDTSTGTGFSVLSNDTAGSTATLVGGGATAHGGQVALDPATGTFTYNPPRGFLGTDTFQYTITNGAQTAGPATVTLHVGGMAWFVDGRPGACSSACDGRRSNPYVSLAAFQAANGAAGVNPAAGDSVFLYEAAAAYTGPLTLLDSQRLVGQDATTSFAVATGLTVPDTTVAVPVMNAGNPTATTVVSQAVPSVNAVNLAQGNTLAGLTVSAVDNAAVERNGPLGTATFSDLKIMTSGSSDGIVIQSATGSLDYVSGSITASGSGAALRITGGNASIGVGASIAVTSGMVASITGRTGGSLTVAGNIAAQGSASGISISTPTGPHTVTFTGGVQLGVAGQSLTGGPAVQINQAGTASTTTFSSLSIVSSGQTAIDAQNGGTLVVTAGSINASNGRALNLSGTAVNVTLTGITTSAGPAQAIRMANVTGSFANGPTSLSGHSQQGILVTGSSVNASFGNTTIHGGSDGVSLQSNSGGTRTFGTLAIANNPAGVGFLHTNGGGNVTVTGAATIGNTNGASVQIQGAPAGTAISFLGGLTATKSLGTAVSLGGAGAAANSPSATLSFGALNVTASNGTAIQAVSSPLAASGGTVSANAGAAIDSTSATFGAGFTSVSSVNSSSQGVKLASAAGTLTIGGGSISGAAANSFDVSGGTVDVTYGGSISQSSAAFAVAVANATGGTKIFSGAITSTGNGRGVSLTSNSGAAAVFTGGMNLSTGSNPAFTATGGGMLTVTQNNTTSFNVLSTTTGTALNVSSVTIGTLGVTFRSISCTGAVSGIVLASTGLGPFAISGNGGSCSTPLSCTGGAILSSTGPGISLTSTGAVSLTRVAVENGSDDGIRGTTVGGFTLTSSRIVNNGNAAGEHGIDMTNLSGSGGIASSTLTGNAESHLKIANSAGVLSAFNVAGSTFSNTPVSTGRDGIAVVLSGTTSATVSVTGSTFSHNHRSHLSAMTVPASANVTLNLTFTGNALSGDRGSPYGGTDIGGNVSILAADNAQVQFDVSNNGTSAAPWIGAVDSAIRIRLDPASNAASLLHGTVHGNFIGSASTTESGSSNGDGLEVRSEGLGTTRIASTNNTIRETHYHGMFFWAFNSSGRSTLHATVTGNTVSSPTSSFGGVDAQVANGNGAGDTSLLCFDFGGPGALANTVAAGGLDVSVGQAQNTTMRLPGYAGGPTDYAAIRAYFQGRNNAPLDVGAGGGFMGGAACTAP